MPLYTEQPERGATLTPNEPLSELFARVLNLSVLCVGTYECVTDCFGCSTLLAVGWRVLLSPTSLWYIYKQKTPKVSLHSLDAIFVTPSSY